MRLTKKNVEIVIDNGTGYANLYNKLSQLEDIEDELGIDLITLFKALKNGIYVNAKWNGIMLFEHTRLVKYKNGWRLLAEGSVFYLTTYGKTWALTKEELL